MLFYFDLHLRSLEAEIGKLRAKCATFLSGLSSKSSYFRDFSDRFFKKALLLSANVGANKGIN